MLASISSITSNFFNSLFKTRSFNYFDDNDLFQTKQMNFIQCFFRKLGFYSETHLKNVVNRACHVTFRPANKVTSSQYTSLFKLFAKVEQVYGAFYSKLYEIIENDQKVKLTARFNPYPGRPIVEFKLSKQGIERSVYFTRPIPNEVHVEFDKSIFEEKDADLNRVATALVPAILRATTTIDQLFTMVPKRPSNGWYNKDSVQGMLMTFGWRYTSTINYHGTEQCVYIQNKKEIINKENMINVACSLNFASAFLMKNDVVA